MVVVNSKTEFVKLCEYVFQFDLKLMKYQSLSSSQFLRCFQKIGGITAAGQTKHCWQGQKHSYIFIRLLVLSLKFCQRRLDVYTEAHQPPLSSTVQYQARFLTWCLTTAFLKDTPRITLTPARDETQSRPSIVQRCAEGHRLSSASWRKEFLAFHSVAKIDQNWYSEQAKAITSKVLSDL